PNIALKMVVAMLAEDFPRSRRLLPLSAEGIVERVPGPAHGADRIPLTPSRQRLAQAPDMHVHRAFVDLRRMSPHGVEQLRARKHPAGLFQKIFEQPEFRRTEVDLARAAADPPPLPVEIEIAGVETLGDPLGPAAPEQR